MSDTAELLHYRAQAGDHDFTEMTTDERIATPRREPGLAPGALEHDCRSIMMPGGGQLLLRPCGPRIEVLLDGRTLLGEFTRRGGVRRRGSGGGAGSEAWRWLRRQLQRDEELFAFAMAPLGLRGSCCGWDFTLCQSGLYVRKAKHGELTCVLQGMLLGDDCHSPCTLEQACVAPLSAAAARFVEALIRDEQLRAYLALPEMQLPLALPPQALAPGDAAQALPASARLLPGMSRVRPPASAAAWFTRRSGHTAWLPGNPAGTARACRHILRAGCGGVHPELLLTAGGPARHHGGVGHEDH